jgi:hypothetical protein
MEPHHRPPDHLERRYTSYIRLVDAIASKCSLLSPQLSLPQVPFLVELACAGGHCHIVSCILFLLVFTFILVFEPIYVLVSS